MRDTDARAVRRHHRERMQAKALKVYPEHPHARHYADHLKMCSCPMCGNPRKWFGEPTRQERRAESSE